MTFETAKNIVEAIIKYGRLTIAEEEALRLILEYAWQYNDLADS